MGSEEGTPLPVGVESGRGLSPENFWDILCEIMHFEAPFTKNIGNFLASSVPFYAKKALFQMFSVFCNVMHRSSYDIRCTRNV